jgi:hypothetical protein
MLLNYRDRGNGCFQHCIWPLALQSLLDIDIIDIILINFFFFVNFLFEIQKKFKKKFKFLIPGINCLAPSFNLRYIWFRPNHWLSQKPYEIFFKYAMTNVALHSGTSSSKQPDIIFAIFCSS